MTKSVIDETEQRNDQRPRYIINPAAVPTAWAGPSWGYRGFRNRNWINSIWLGTGWHALCLPQRFWWEVARPTRRDPLGVVGHTVRFLVLTLGYCALGVTGWLVMLPFPLEVVARARILDNEEAIAALRLGQALAVRRSS